MYCTVMYRLDRPLADASLYRTKHAQTEIYHAIVTQESEKHKDAQNEKQTLN